MSAATDHLRYDVRLRLDAWGSWVVQRCHGSLGYGQSPLASMMTRVARTEPGSRVPVLEIECSRTDDLVQALVPELRQVALLYWGYRRTIRDIARQERISTTTAQRRIEAVVEGICQYVRAGYEKVSARPVSA